MKNNEWLSFLDNLDIFEIEARKNCECLFDDGTICNYFDEQPFAVLTHFKPVQEVKE